jgi:polyhydroxyalkanoate synthesis regulator phasin
MATTKKSNPGQDALRKLLLAGLGLADETNQKLHQNFNALVKKGQAREPEIKKAVADVRKKADAKRKELEKKVSDFLKHNEIVKSKEFQGLLKKVEELQKKVTGTKPAAKKVATKPAAKKAVAKKKPAKKAAAKKPAAKSAAPAATEGAAS